MGTQRVRFYLFSLTRYLLLYDLHIPHAVGFGAAQEGPTYRAQNLNTFLFAVEKKKYFLYVFFIRE